MTADIAFAPTDRNTGDWTAVNEFYRFSPGASATPNYIFEWYDDIGIPLGTDPILQVSPTETTTYTATMTYTQCAGPNITVTDQVTITVPERVSIQPVSDLNICDDDNDGFAEFDLTLVEAELLGTQTGLEVTYHNTLTDAETAVNAIASPLSYTNTTVNTELIFVRVVAPTDGCFAIESFSINALITPMVTIDSSAAYEVCPNATQPITISAIASNFNESDVSISWDLDGAVLPGETTLDLNSVLLEGDYTITVTNTSTSCSASETVSVIELDSCVIPQGISPNNDGLNDRFDLSSFDVQSLEIFNRNGRKVYVKNNGYKNEWFGQTDNGDELPTGTYYYVMRFNGDQVKASYVYINR
jgi:gliding motility-associated-like protein